MKIKHQYIELSAFTCINISISITTTRIISCFINHHWFNGRNVEIEALQALGDGTVVSSIHLTPGRRCNFTLDLSNFILDLSNFTLDCQISFWICQISFWICQISLWICKIFVWILLQTLMKIFFKETNQSHYFLTFSVSVKIWNFSLHLPEGEILRVPRLQQEFTLFEFQASFWK